MTKKKERKKEEKGKKKRYVERESKEREWDTIEEEYIMDK